MLVKHFYTFPLNMLLFLILLDLKQLRISQKTRETLRPERQPACLGLHEGYQKGSLPPHSVPRPSPFSCCLVLPFPSFCESSGTHRVGLLATQTVPFIRPLPTLTDPRLTSMNTAPRVNLATAPSHAGGPHQTLTTPNTKTSVCPAPFQVAPPQVSPRTLQRPVG